MSAARLACADAALALFRTTGGPGQAWLLWAPISRIMETHEQLASHYRGSITIRPRYVEHYGARIIAAPGSPPGGDSDVADAAQWLWMNRELVGFDLSTWPSSMIVRAARACKKWDAQPCWTEDKKYSLSDLRRAYDMGFGASGEGWNGEVTYDYSDDEHYQAKRLEALKEFK